MLNVAVLMGRLVADPELRHTSNDVSVTSFRLAVDRTYVKAVLTVRLILSISLLGVIPLILSAAISVRECW